ncbi:MAG: hypothetical protein KC418_21445 [Anaerolineales bacterium]|nr:hypothetical protein [Anaerolineales bacterium]MCB8950801.1 hypothetical protein [Ardenticatenales bacterium]
MHINHGKRYSWKLMGSLLICLTLAGLARAQEVAPSPVYVEPARKQIVAGETGEVAVMVTDAVDLYGFDVTLSFDPTVVQVVDANPGTPDRIEVGFGTFLDSGFEVRNVADNDAGTIRFAMTQINPSSPKSGSGVLLVLTFLGVQSGGSTPLIIADAQLSQPRGILVPAAFAEGSGLLEVVDAGTEDATTPIPVQAGTNPDISLTLTAMSPTGAAATNVVSTPIPTTAPTIPSPPTPTPTATSTPSFLDTLSTFQIIGLTTISCLLLLLLLGAVGLLLSRRRRKEDETP